MPESAGHLAKAQLIPLDASRTPIEPDRICTVQFNPESLKVSFSNQIVPPAGGGSKTGTAARQFVGAGMTKLALTLWFDVGSQVPKSTVEAVPNDPANAKDVRELTGRVTYFITPTAGAGGQFVPPGVRFLWGSFQFDGLMDSLEESLEYFSPEGRPLRASMALSLSQQRVQTYDLVALKTAGAELPPTLATGDAAGTGAGGADTSAAAGLVAPPAAAGAAPPQPAGRTPGTKHLKRAKARETIQKLADAAGKASAWQSIAAANGIENPRFVEAGKLLDLSLKARTISTQLGLDTGLAIAPAPPWVGNAFALALAGLDAADAVDARGAGGADAVARAASAAVSTASSAFGARG